MTTSKPYLKSFSASVLFLCIILGLHASAYSFESLPNSFNGIQFGSKPTSGLKLTEKMDIVDPATNCSEHNYEPTSTNNLTFVNTPVKNVVYTYCNGKSLNVITITLQGGKFMDIVNNLTNTYGKPHTASLKLPQKFHVWQDSKKVMILSANNDEIMIEIRR